MPTIVGIFIFMSMINFNLTEHEKVLQIWIHSAGIVPKIYSRKQED